MSARGVAALTLATTLAACGGAGPRSAAGPAGEEPRRGGTLVVAVLADVDSWNPYTTRDTSSAAIVDLLYPRLVHETGTGFEPWLARSYEFSSDRLSLTFHLEPLARWSDGRPVTCADVRFTREAQLAPGLAWPGAFVKERILGIDCPDEHTAVFRFSESYPDQLVDANDDAIVSAIYAAVPFAEWGATSWQDRLVSSGPFRLAAVRAAQEAVLEREPAFWAAPAPFVDRVVFRIYPEATGALPAFLEGEVDFLTAVPPLAAAEVGARPERRLVDLPSMSYTYIGWNSLARGAYLEDRRARGCAADRPCAEKREDLLRLARERPHPVLADPRVRRALTLGIDRRDLVDGLWAGFARPGSTPIVSALWPHDPTGELPFDPRRAVELLEEAGWRDPDGDGLRERSGLKLELSVIVNAENRMRREALERVAASLAGIGVGLRPEPLPRREFVERARDKEFDAVLGGWSAGTRIQPWMLLDTEAALDRGNNVVSWSTPASDALFARARHTVDPEETRALWREWQTLYREEQPLTILYEERHLCGLSRRVHGPDPPFVDPLQNLHAWWLSGAGPGSS